MSNAMEVILLERVESLGKMGELVRVKTGYARNFLLPQKKALRATKDNIAYYEAQRATLEKASGEQKKEAEKISKKLEGAKVSLIRLASEAGQLFGSVNARDIADVISEQTGVKVARNQIILNLSLKTVGLFTIPVVLHPELKVDVVVNIARSLEEAKIQAETGRALTTAAKDQDSAEDTKSSLLEDSALKAEELDAAEDAEKAAEKAEKAAKKAAKPKKAPKAGAEEATEE